MAGAPRKRSVLVDFVPFVIDHRHHDSADALRSLIIFQELSYGKEIAVVHHTDCGMLRISTDEIHAGTKNIPADMHFHEFNDIDEGVRRDVRWLKERVQEGALLEGTNVMGYILENETGKASRTRIR